MGGRDCIKDEVEAPGGLGHLLFRAGKNHLMGTQALGICHLSWRSCEADDMGPEGVGKLESHMPQSSQANHAYLLARTDLPVAEWRVGRDACAEEWCGGGGVDFIGNFQDEALVDDDLVRVTAEVQTASISGLAVVCASELIFTVVLQTLVAVGAGAAGINETADSDPVTRGEFCHGSTDLLDHADDLVAGNHRVKGTAPFIASLMDVRVTDAAVGNLQMDIMGARFTVLEREGGERCGCGLGSVAFGRDHGN